MLCWRHAGRPRHSQPISQTGHPRNTNTHPAGCLMSCAGRCSIALDPPVPFDVLVDEDQELLRSQPPDVAPELQAAITQACVNEITFNNKVHP